MAHGDRMALAIKDFGRRVIIEIKRGKAEWSKKPKKLTITYRDAPMRKQ